MKRGIGNGIRFGGSRELTWSRYQSIDQRNGETLGKKFIIDLTRRIFYFV